MDGIYRSQRHFYDLTRKYYLLGRDGLIADLAPPPGGTVLEIGCGTGRNLVLAARRWPQARLFGIDISPEMLKSARAALDRAGLGKQVAVAAGDATNFDAAAALGTARFDRVYISYSLSMIPQWRAALAHAAGLLAPGGQLHIVDFGDQAGLPRWFRMGLRAWLARFHVRPRDELPAALAALAAQMGASVAASTPYRGYAVRAVLTAPA